jgi:transposase-like protein
MSKNKIQFQKGLSEPEFENSFGTEEQCWEQLVQWRRPSGFRCPHCESAKYGIVGPRKLFQCGRCHAQTPVTSGTIFDSAKLPLKTWFRAMYHLTQGKGGISSIELGRRLGISQPAAWRMSHKLMQVMYEREMSQPLGGRIEMDDAYLGGKDSGGKRGRGADHKTPFVAAVETNDEGNPIRMKMMCVNGFRKEEIMRLGRIILTAGSDVFTDGLSCFQSVTECGCLHTPIKTNGNKEAQNTTFKWVNTVLGNVKKSINGTYQTVHKHCHRYLASFSYRFNRRFDLSTMLTRLAWVSLRTAPMPFRLLKQGLL